MRSSMYLVVICLAVAAHAAPAPNPQPNPEPNPQPNPEPSSDDRPEIIEIIAPAASAQETLSTLNLGAPGSELSERNKRTIGILRQLFPTLTQIIEQKVQQITSMVLQTLGPVVLRSFLGNRGGDGGNNNAGGGTVELDDDDDDDDDEEVTVPTSTTLSTTLGVTTLGVTTPEEEDEKRRKRSLYFLPNAVADENQLLSGAESQQAEVRVAFGENQGQADQQQAASNDDQQTAAQTNSASIDEITLDDADNSEENRNKRFLSFGAQGGSSGGGSGNFLFDIVREYQVEVDVVITFLAKKHKAAENKEANRFAFVYTGNLYQKLRRRYNTVSEEALDIVKSHKQGSTHFARNQKAFLPDERPAEAMARAAGTAFRLFAGTDSLNVGLTATHTASLEPNDQQLVAGSSSGSSSGEAGAAAEGEDAGAAKGDNLTEGVPGPITRLFIIANRGIANLIQDLILRIAQTSERIVNFKARLITSII